MNIPFENCLTFINCHLNPPLRGPFAIPGPVKRAITISRQSGSGGHAVAERLAACLQARTSADECPWTVFDRELVHKVLEEHHLPKSVERFMAEDRISEMADTMDELFGLHPPSWLLVRKTAETVLRLAELGNVILIGRGAAVITRKLDYVFHVRLVGSLNKRVEHMQSITGLNRRDAEHMVNRDDRGRRRYLKKYFGKDIDDPLLYHLVINTDSVPYAAAGELIADAILMRKTEEKTVAA
jgi:cytidylate kinase